MAEYTNKQEGGANAVALVLQGVTHYLASFEGLESMPWGVITLQTEYLVVERPTKGEEATCSAAAAHGYISLSASFPNVQRSACQIWR